MESLWSWAWRELGAEPPAGLLDALLARYDEPRRAYHTRRHLGECLDAFALVRDACARPAEVALALFFHDAVYNPRRTDNEQQSADWLARAARDAGVAPDAVARLVALVLATRHGAAPTDPDAQALADVDLAILGAPPARFDEYEAQIRREYRWVPGFAFRRARVALLKEFLQRPRLYATPVMHERLEAQARANLSRSLRRLGAAPTR